MSSRIHTEQAPTLDTPWPFLGMAQLFALTGLVLLAFHARLIVRNLVGDPAVVSMVHLFTLGTITMAMMGALYQWVPVVSGSSPVPARKAHLQFVLFTLGVLVFVPGIATGSTPLLVIGGLALESGIGLFLYNIASIGLLRRVRLPGTALVATGLAALAGTAILGGLMAARLATRAVVPASWLSVHLILGLGGFAGFVLAGVSYRLLPMFLPAPSHRPRAGWVLGLGLAALVTGVLEAEVPSFPAAIPLLALMGAGLFYLLDVSQYWRERRRRTPDGLLLLVGASHLGLVAALITSGLALATGQDLWPAAIACSVLGWYLLAWLGFSQRILPFIGWLHGMRAGRRDTPHVTVLWPPLFGWAMSIGALAGTGGVLAGILIHLTWLIQVGALLLAGSIVWFHAGYWRMFAQVRHPKVGWPGGRFR